MYFSIPETVTQSDGGEKGTKYTGYCVHVNGVFHCLVRYSQLHRLHDQMRRQFPLPTFPPKKLFNLSDSQIEERREMLEKYLQLISQDHRVTNSQIFNMFLLMAQQETRGERSENVSLEVFLMNDQKIIVNILTVEHTEVVLQQVCEKLNVPDHLIYCFSLFLITRDHDGDITIVRKLQDFESPYISQKAIVSDTLNKNIPSTLKIMMRKSSWDPAIDDQLLVETPTLNLLYIQTVADIERGWIITSNETKQQLALMQASGSKRQYMEVARSLKYFGYLVFRPSVSDHPEQHSNVTISIGCGELSMRMFNSDGDVKEVVYKVTRIKCWRIMSIEGSDSILGTNRDILELSFEYLVTQDTLEWITILSDQAILMSMCLQSMVEELVRIRDGEKDALGVVRCQAKIRPGQVQVHENGGDVGCDFTISKLTERFSVVNMSSTSRAAEDVFVENEIYNSTIDEESPD